MKVTPRLIGIAGLLVAVAIAIYLLWLWQPERQVALHQRHLLDAAQDRNWKKVGRFLSADYHDRWGFTRDTAPQAGGEVFRHFFTLEVRVQSSGLTVNRQAATAFDRLTLDGTGTFVAQEVVSRVNSLSKPFKFEWRRASSWPWDWKLVSVDQQELRLPDVSGFL